MGVHSRQDGGVTVITLEEIVLFLSEGHRIEDLPFHVQRYIHESLSYEDKLSLEMISEGNAKDTDSDEEGDEGCEEE